MFFFSSNIKYSQNLRRSAATFMQHETHVLTAMWRLWAYKHGTIGENKRAAWNFLLPSNA